MPDQLSKSKKRQSFAEHEAVLVALTEIARHEYTTVMALLRQAVRELVKKRVKEPIQAERLRQVIFKKAQRCRSILRPRPKCRALNSRSASSIRCCWIWS